MADAPVDQVVLIRIKDLAILLSRKTAHSSEAWNFFGKLKYKNETLNSNRFYCNVCLETAKKTNKEQTFSSANVTSFGDKCSTTNMIGHLRNDHQIAPQKSSPGSNALTDYYSTTGRKSLPAAQKSLVFHRDIVLWFAKDLRPFNDICKVGITDFMLKYDVIKEKNQLPHPTTLSRGALTDVYNTTKEVVDNMLSKSPGHGSLTVDMWTDSHAHRKYAGFTYHFISEDWNLVNLTLRVASLPKAHTAANIKTEIKTTQKIFGLLRKNITILRDNGANIKLACQEGGFKSFGCVGHGLHNLVVKDGVEQVIVVGALLTKCRLIVRRLCYKSEELMRIGDEEIRRDLENVAQLESILVADCNFDVESSEAPVVEAPTTLKRDTPTRWSSILEMFQSLLRNRRSVSKMMVITGRADDDIDEEQYELMAELAKFLSLFKAATECLCGSTYPTANLALLFRSEIECALKSTATDSETVKSMKYFMRKNLDKRFPVTDHLVTAALLDPRLQNLSEISNFLQEKHQDKAQFLKMQASGFAADARQAHEVDIEPPAEKKSCFRDLIRKHSVVSDASVGLEHEISSLLSAPPVESQDVIEFWKKNCLRLPTLAKLAVSVLGVPATSVPCERLFSIAGLVVSAKRASLNPYNVDRLVFIHDNYDYCKQGANKR